MERKTNPGSPSIQVLHASDSQPVPLAPPPDGARVASKYGREESACKLVVEAASTTIVL